ncbi:hypothetical protein Cantr_05715 [Candida viswanathii]|uniref:DUF676 domain-containing protein n=1 Tax=Candida viswanathii TaxID=5486 RepID=A0A367XS99_9ASCO|nr:hypothetical protein Cantr_05715 [Candida viswanathii]
MLVSCNRRYVEYTRIDPSVSQIYLRLKNVEKTTIRAIHLLSGPFILYCHVVPVNYNYRKQFHPDDVEKNSEIVFENQIKPNQSLNATLLLNLNSLKGTNDSGNSVFQWEVEVVSQIVITTKTEVVYDLLIGDDLRYLKKLNGHNMVAQTLTNLGSNGKDHHNAGEAATSTPTQTTMCTTLSCTSRSDGRRYLVERTEAPGETCPFGYRHSWDIFQPNSRYALHQGPARAEGQGQPLGQGYRYNAGRTEKGVKKLGTNVANYIIDLIEEGKYTFDKISFIAHSLGGLVQLYAIKYILLTKGVDYFEKAKIKPTNLICMASPLLGILNEMNFLISWVLDIGTLGKTGRDLTLLNRLPAWSDISIGDSKKRDSFRPVLETLPDDPLEKFLGKFEQLVVYANAINDGIVPLRTSALLYLDYEALGDVSELKKYRHINEHPELRKQTTPLRQTQAVILYWKSPKRTTR